jgi:hypothetical protein
MINRALGRAIPKIPRRPGDGQRQTIPQVRKRFDFVKKGEGLKRAGDLRQLCQLLQLVMEFSDY